VSRGLPLELFLGLRYLTARGSRANLSLFVWIGVGGVFLGVAALIVVLAVSSLRLGRDTWLRDGVLVMATALCGLRPVLVRAERRSWLIFAAALGGWTLAEIVSSLALRLAFYPMAVIALIALLRSGAAKTATLRTGVGLDGVTAGLGAAALAAAFGLSTGPDLVLLVLAVAALARRWWRPGPATTVIRASSTASS